MSDEEGFMGDEGASTDHETEVGGKIGFLPAIVIKILKYVIIGVVLLIAMIVVASLVVRCDSAKRASAGMPGVSQSISQVKPIYTWFEAIGDIRGRTADEAPHMVMVTVTLGYDGKNKALATELSNRIIELKDLVRSFFATKTKKELYNEEETKKDLKERINATLKDGKVEEIAFPSFSVIET